MSGLIVFWVMSWIFIASAVNAYLAMTDFITSSTAGLGIFALAICGTIGILFFVIFITEVLKLTNGKRSDLVNKTVIMTPQKAKKILFVYVASIVFAILFAYWLTWYSYNFMGGSEHWQH